MARDITGIIQNYLDPFSGRPIGLGKIYVGRPNTDPRIPSNQIPVTVIEQNGDVNVAAQPIAMTIGGQPFFTTASSRFTVEEDFSIAVDDANDAQIYYIPKSASQIDGVGQYLVKGADETRPQGLPAPEDDPAFSFTPLVGASYEYRLVVDVLSEAAKLEAGIELIFKGPSNSRYSIAGMSERETLVGVQSAQMIQQIPFRARYYSYEFSGYIRAGTAAGDIIVAWRPIQTGGATTATVTMNENSYFWVRRIASNI